MKLASGGVIGWIGRIPEFTRQVRAETNKVAWPTRRETMMTTVMVLIMTTLLGIFFFGVDFLFSKVREAVFALLV